MSQVEQLYKLQQIDTEIREKKQRLGEVLAAQRETEALLAARERLETAVAELKSWQTQQTDLNLALKGVNAKAKQAETRLYSGNVKNPKELADLQQKIESLGRRREAVEDEILEAMIMIEEAEAEEETAAVALEEIEAEWQKVQAGYKAEQNELALRLHSLNEARQEQLKLIDPTALKEYEALKKNRAGVAVVRMQNDLCTGCRVNIPEHKVREARQGQKVYCNQCGRILYPFN